MDTLTTLQAISNILTNHHIGHTLSTSLQIPTILTTARKASLIIPNLTTNQHHIWITDNTLCIRELKKPEPNTWALEPTTRINLADPNLTPQLLAALKCKP